MPREFSLRAVPEELRMRYQREGLWTDDTLGAVHEQARRLAAGMRARSLGPGDVVAFQLPNWTEAAASFFGLSMLGAVVVRIVHSYGPREVGFILRQSGARALITADRFGRHDYAATLATPFVRPRPGKRAPDLEAVRLHLESAGLARPKWPEELRTVDEFPRTPSGKIKKFVLRETLRATPGRRGDR